MTARLATRSETATGRFLSWLKDKGYEICELVHDDDSRHSFEYCPIDLGRIAQEYQRQDTPTLPDRQRTPHPRRRQR